MFLDGVKWLLGSSVIAAVVTAWLSRREKRVQSIPLVERVNRLVDPKLHGFTVARFVGVGSERRLEEVKGVREIQLTLRNTSSVHLHNCEIQFEFPTADVEAWIERPARSNTAPIQVDAEVTPPWKKGFRWRIPQFPSTDSIELTFRAVDCPSDNYAVALYNSAQVVVHKSKGEATTRRRFSGFMEQPASFPVWLLIILGTFWMTFRLATGSVRGEHRTEIAWAGCSLDFESSFHQEDDLQLFSHHGPWLLTVDVINTGSRKCFVQFEYPGLKAFSVDAGEEQVFPSVYVSERPVLVPFEIVFGPDHPINRATVALFKAPR